MEKFDINKVVDYWGLDPHKVAPVIYPTLKHPYAAMRRLLAGEDELDINQVGALASYIGVTTADLLNVDSWQGLYNEGVLTFRKKNYTIRFKYDCAYATLYKDDMPIRTLILADKLITVKDFINLIDNQIKNYENGSTED